MREISIENVTFELQDFIGCEGMSVAVLDERGDVIDYLTVSFPGTLTPTNCSYLDIISCGDIISEMIDIGYIKLLSKVISMNGVKYPLGYFTNTFFETAAVIDERCYTA